MKLTDKEYRILLAECASRLFYKGIARATAVDQAKRLLAECGIENERDEVPQVRGD